MFIWTARTARVEAIGAPSPLLTHLAGEFAPRVAGLWPEPHRPFVEAASERRHLVCLALSRTDAQLDGALAPLALAAPLRRALKRLVPDSPDGLGRALERLGEVAWPAEDYARLLDLLGQPETCKLVRHAEAITRDWVGGLAALTPALHRAGLGRVGLTQPQVAALHELHVALTARDGLQAADAAARGWAQDTDIAAIFRRADASIRRSDLVLPFPNTGQLRGLRSLAAIEEAGGRYKNCLGTLSYAGDPDYAFYEWLGEPGVMVEIYRDRLFGWSLSQASCIGNEAPPEAARNEVTFALRKLGVHVGRDSGGLSQALTRAACGRRVTPIDAAIRGWYGA